jgi:hypothetical protein
MHRNEPEELHPPTRPPTPLTLTRTDRSSVHPSITATTMTSSERIQGRSTITTAPRKRPQWPSAFIQLSAHHRHPPQPNANSLAQPIIVKCQAHTSEKTMMLSRARTCGGCRSHTPHHTPPGWSTASARDALHIPHQGGCRPQID